MSKQDEIRKLQEQTRYQVQVIPDKGSPYALDLNAHKTAEAAHTALTAFVKAQLGKGAGVGTDPRATEFPDAVYLTGGPDGWLRARVIERSAWDCLPAAESDAHLAEAAQAEAQEQEAARTADLERARTEAALFAAKRDASKDPNEAAQLATLAERAGAQVESLERQIEERALEVKRNEVLSTSAVRTR